MTQSVISNLLQDPGPFASAYVEVSRDGEDGEQRVAIAARDAADGLVEQGAPPALADRVREALTQNTHEPAPVSRCVVVTERGLLLDRLTLVRRPQPVVTYGVLPDVAAWLADESDASGFVLALVDHRGGDVVTYSSATIRQREHAEVGEASPYENKVRGGGWSHLNMQRSTETVWARNADEVIEEVARQAGEDTRLILVGGEADVRRTVADAQQAGSAEVVELESASRGLDGGEDDLWAEIAEVLEGRAVSRRLAAVHELRDRLGQGRQALTGVTAVTEAMIRGQVQRLLIDPEAAASHTVDPSDHPGLALGAVEARDRLRSDQLLIAMAGLTDADVVVTNASTMAGAAVAATLRW